MVVSRSSTPPAEVGAAVCPKLSITFLTPQYLALRGLSSIGEKRAQPIVKMLRSLPYATINGTCRSWSVRAEDYPRLIAAVKAAGCRVNNHRAKDVSEGSGAPECVDRPPDALVKALVSQPWPLLKADEIAARLQAVPPFLASSLLPFQEEGVRFAISRGGRALIADEMGLGKTVQAIAVASAFRDEWPLLVVCPSSLRLNWRHELTMWLPGEEIKVLFTGAEAAQCFERPLPNVTIISYDLLAVANRRPACLKAKFSVVIADESHYIRNGQSARCKAVSAVVEVSYRFLYRWKIFVGIPSLLS